MLLSIKLTVVPIISLAIIVLLGILIYKAFSKKSSRASIIYIAVSIVLLFGLVVMMNLKNKEGEYYWRGVNEPEKEEIKKP